MDVRMSTEWPRKAIILIVDDVARNLQVLGNIIRSEDYQISFATSGLKALDMVEELMPDLILLDVMMPEMDGYQVCARLKENPKVRHVPVIFLTAKTDAEDILKGFSFGAVDYVTKPFNAGELAARIRTHLDLKFSKDVILRQNEEFNELVHVLCHDLLNPIGSARSIIDLMDSPEALADMLPHLRVALDSGLEIIDLVRKIRSLTEGKSRLVVASCLLSPSLRRCATMLEHRCKVKDITIEIKVADDLAACVEEVSFAGSVINNLLTNAIKFSHHGDVITVAGGLEEENVILEVIDQGIGIPAGILSRLFDVKASISRAGTDGEEGTGFGMPLVKKFVEAYGGDIAIISKDINEFPDDHGTRVRLTLRRG